MMINSTGMTYSPQTLQRQERPLADPGKAPGIGEQVTSAINKINELQQNASTLVEQVASGNVEDVHKAMVAMEQASMAMDFTLQVRNKVLEAYQEIMRMQI
ncbi:MAG: flagellar hook-basal body complex protein FliE [Armatimonadota bacterium]